MQTFTVTAINRQRRSRREKTWTWGPLPTAPYFSGMQGTKQYRVWPQVSSTQGETRAGKPSSAPTPSFCQENRNQSTPNQCRDCSWDLAEPHQAVKQRGRRALENRRCTRRWVRGCPPGCRTSSGCYLPAPRQLSCCKEGNSGAQSCSSGPPCAHSKRGVLSRAGSSLPAPGPTAPPATGAER